MYGGTGRSSPLRLIHGFFLSGHKACLKTTERTFQCGDFILHPINMKIPTLSF